MMMLVLIVMVAVSSVRRAIGVAACFLHKDMALIPPPHTHTHLKWYIPT